MGVTRGIVSHTCGRWYTGLLSRGQLTCAPKRQRLALPASRLQSSCSNRTSATVTTSFSPGTCTDLSSLKRTRRSSAVACVFSTRSQFRKLRKRSSLRITKHR
uniref:Uncharacterized protein n=1 Tax=Ixodes ricinus TaxID=34613 RepID=A0A0K8R4W8_IXORI